jgi:hypothetical protein
LNQRLPPLRSLWIGFCYHDAIGLEHLILGLLKTPRGRAIVALLVVTAGSFFGLIFVPNLEPLHRLRSNYRLVNADVIDHRIDRGEYGLWSEYSLRYRFRLPGLRDWYEQTESGPLARKELWASLPKEQWSQACKSGHVTVAYCATEPANNDLAVNLPTAFRYVYAGAVVSIAMVTLGIFWLGWIATFPFMATPTARIDRLG